MAALASASFLPEVSGAGAVPPATPHGDGATRGAALGLAAGREEAWPHGGQAWGAEDKLPRQGSH